MASAGKQGQVAFETVTGHMQPLFRVTLLSAVATGTISSLLGQSAPTPAERLRRPILEERIAPATLPEVVVTAQEDAVAAKLEETRQNHPGSVSTVSPQEINLQKTNNLGEVLNRIPGAVYVDEDGRGTKPDISLRGLNPIRSEFVQLLQDGVPIQPSLYSEQAAYYGVPMERVAGIEVFKGGASILFGPNTVGGVVNLISRSPSSRPFAAVLDTRYDSYGDYSGNLFVSGTRGNVFAGIEYLHKGGDGFRDSLGYNIDDVDVKLGYRFNEDHSAQLRFQYYDEASETPGGLLPDQFASDRTQTNKPHDEFFGKRVAADIRSSHQLTERQRVDLLLYAFRFERNWFLQNFVSDTTPDLSLADSNGQFLREFTVVGFEPKYTLDYDLGNTTGHQLTLGARVYHDSVNRRTALGNDGAAREGDGVLTAEDDLSTLAFAGYLQNEFKLTKRLSIVPGVRYEHIEQTREDVFADLAEQSSTYNVWVPGLGVKYDFAPRSQAYANVTRSFRPPTFGDTFNPAIGASSADLKASTAWTYEAGIRANPFPWLLADVGGFRTDFSDQVVVSGNTAANFDTETYGFEGVCQVGLLGLTHGIREGNWNFRGDHEVFLLGGATLVKSTFANGVFEGNDLPYVPNQTVTFGARYAFRESFDVVLQGRYVSDRFTDNANTVEENAIATVGELSDYVVFDLKARWQATEQLALNAGINNLFDESYGTQRRTGQQKGVFPGPTRSVYVAATLSF